MLGEILSENTTPRRHNEGDKTIELLIGWHKQKSSISLSDLLKYLQASFSFGLEQRNILELDTNVLAPC